MAARLSACVLCGARAHSKSRNTKRHTADTDQPTNHAPHTHDTRASDLAAGATSAAPASPQRQAPHSITLGLTHTAHLAQLCA